MAKAAPQFLTVPKLGKWQHYKDRTPPWIKLHRDLLRNYDFTALPDATKAHLMLIWLLASQLDNHIPYDRAYIHRAIGSHRPPDIAALLAGGWLELEKGSGQNASKPQAKRSALSSIRETEAEAEGEAEPFQEEDSVEGYWGTRTRGAAWGDEAASA